MKVAINGVEIFGASFFCSLNHQHNFESVSMSKD